MKKSTLLKLSPIFLLLSLLAGSTNVAFADEKTAETTVDIEKAAAETTADIEKAAGDAASDAKSDAAADGDKKKDAKEPDCD